MTDAQLARNVQDKINADGSVPANAVTASASDQIVTLSGKVQTDAQRSAASQDAAQVEGVRSVINNLEVEPAVAAARSGAMTPIRGPRPVNSGLRTVSASAVTVPEGTAISIRLIDSIDSDRNKPGDMFRATLETPIMSGGRVAVSKGADVVGQIVDLQSAGHFAGRSDLALVLTSLNVMGKEYQLQTDELLRQGASRGVRTAETIGGGAGVGALIGGLAGGGKGAAIGAGVGAGAGTAVQAATKGQQVRLPSETVLEFRLKAPLTVNR